MSINSTIAVDLLGQCASETVGGSYYSSSGGQADFARGAMYSQGGQGFVVLHSTAKDGAISKIVPQLAAGDVVTTLKNTVDKVVTEWGVAELRGRSIRERAAALIAIAHPDHRDRLTFEAQRLGRLVARYRVSRFSRCRACRAGGGRPWPSCPSGRALRPSLLGLGVDDPQFGASVLGRPRCDRRRRGRRPPGQPRRARRRRSVPSSRQYGAKRRGSHLADGYVCRWPRSSCRSSASTDAQGDGALVRAVGLRSGR